MQITNEGKKIGSNESELVTRIRKFHCKGCMNENGYCSATETLDCWLRKTYLPEGEYSRAFDSDLIQKNVVEIEDEINKEILKKVLNN